MTGIPVAPGELVDTTFLNEIARAHWRKTSTKTVVSSVAETDLFNGEFTIGAGALAANRELRIEAYGSLQNNVATEVFPRLKLKLGTTVLMDSGTGPSQWLASATIWSWEFRATVQNAGATNSQVCRMRCDIMASTSTGGSALPTVGVGVYSSTPYDAAFLQVANNGLAVDTTLAQALALTTILPVSNASCFMSLYAAAVEIV